VGDYLIKKLTNPTTKPDAGFLHEMEQLLEDQFGPNYFNMENHYRFWMKNYGWLQKAPFGVVAVIELGKDEHDKPRYVYQQNPDHCPIRDEDFPADRPGANGYLDAHSISAPDLLTNNAYRLYPIISTTAHGEPHFVWVGAPSQITGEHPDAVRRFSGLLSFTPDPTKHKSYRPDEAVAPFDPRRIPSGERFNETVLPMLIHQNAAAAREFRDAEVENNWKYGCGGSPEECLQQRWDNRKSMFGMHLYPGVGQDDDGFGPAGKLLKTAGTLAYEASQYATVLPAKKSSAAAKSTAEEDKYDDFLWQLQEPQGAVAAYSAEHEALFFWGPKAGPGWDLRTRAGDKLLFETRTVKLVPIGYNAVKNAVPKASGPVDQSDTDDGETSGATPPWMTSGGGPMWAEPRTEILTELRTLAPQRRVGKGEF